MSRARLSARAAPVTGTDRTPPTMPLRAWCAESHRGETALGARRRQMVSDALDELDLSRRALAAIAAGGVALDSGATRDEQVATMQRIAECALRGEPWWRT